MLSVEAARAYDATVAITSYMNELIDRKLADPGDDLLSALLHDHEDDDRLTRRELVAMVVLLLIAGHETTANLLGNSIVALLDQPRALRYCATTRRSTRPPSTSCCASTARADHDADRPRTCRGRRPSGRPGQSRALHRRREPRQPSTHTPSDSSRSAA